MKLKEKSPCLGRSCPGHALCVPGLTPGITDDSTDALYLHLSEQKAPQSDLLLFSCSVVSDSLRPHEPQHTRPPCPSPTPGVHPTHVHRVSDAIQPSHPLSSLSPPALNLSQHQGLFKRVGSSHQVAKVLELQLQQYRSHSGLRVH